MKYITFAIPSYNSEKYMRKCIDALLPGGDDVEIIIVNDGSKDNTGKIADEYEKKYPGICVAVQKENGGHGSGVNKGLELAKGVYYKVIDSDDWLDKDAYPILLNQIKKFVDEDKDVPDLIIGNYIYDHFDEGTKKVIRYNHIFPSDRAFTWNEVKNFTPDKNLLMHSLYYKSETLRKSGIKLPEHTFYVDNIFAFMPLTLCEKLYYMNLDLYHYYIGRADQSVNTSVMCKRIDQQLRVTDIMSKAVDFKKVEREYPKLADYLYQYLEMMYAVSGVHLDIIGDSEAYKKRDKMWKDLRDYDEDLYKRVHSSFARLTSLPRFMVVPVYEAAKKIFKFQ